ncbi:Do family serine endopeptidase [Sphingomonas gilva]|uniref:Probable periplasmic serine endoprotease DegP-like n=1 Tax=Sphingomonas gilva TaxID=2305907 RepID=A0A396RWC4_9SPHN|nr:Do family serine endopeptidase [Sphingomonas gilva]RHW17991.1 Do family serine endopeptidase [Sphingomonas gilva]
MRYAYAITSALLIGGAAATMTLQQPLGAQTPQNPVGMQAAAPRPGAPLSFAELTARLQPAVVNISTTQRVPVQTGNPFAGTPFEDFFGQFGGRRGQGQGGQPATRPAQSLGSGFIISADGYVVTNNHVIAAGTQGAVVEEIRVTLPDRREFVAKLIGRDPESDLALLKIDATGLPFVRFGDSTETRVGDWVLAIGNPFGLGGSVSAGIVSALHRSTGANGSAAYDRYIQTDAAINRGNSGGPMFDLNGNVVGINSSIFSPTGGNVGIGFAIPAEIAKPIIDTLRRGEEVERGYLGVGIQPVTPDIAGSLGLQRNRGELVSRVEPGEGAERGGIQVGDVIVEVNNQEVTPDNTLSFIVANLPVGTRVPIELIRDGRRRTVTVTVGKRPSAEELAGFNADENADPLGSGNPENEAAAANALGLQLTPLTPRIARDLRLNANERGMVIVSVDPSSDAAAKGLRRGLVIQSVNQRPVTTDAEVSAIVAEARRAGRDNVLLYVHSPRERQSIYIAVELSDS